MQRLFWNLTQQIEVGTIPVQRKFICDYIRREKQRKNIITDKMKGRQIITRMLQKWQMLKLEHDARQVQQGADKGTWYQYGDTKG